MQSSTAIHFGNAALTTASSGTVAPSVQSQNEKSNPLHKTVISNQKVDQAQFSKAESSPPKSIPTIWDLPSLKWTQRHLDAKDLYATQQSLTQLLSLQNMQYPDNNGHLKLVLSEPYEFGHMMQHSAIANTFGMLARPVDVILESNTRKSGLMALTSTRGRSFMTPSASITIHAAQEGKHHQTTSDLQIQRWTQEQENQLLAKYMMQKAGIKPDQRETLISTLKTQKGRKSWNALQALYEGQHGLIDGILVGRHQVVTRAQLDEYLQQQGWDAGNPEGKKKIENFLQNCYTNLSHLPTKPLAQVFPETLPQQETSWVHEAHNQSQVRVEHSKLSPYGEEASKAKSRILTNPHLVLENCAMKPNQTYRIYSDAKQPKPPSILSNDAIFFADQIDMQSINTLSHLLEKIDAKRIQQQSDHHIPLFLVSPGGNITSGNAFQDTLQRLKTPVDIILTGTSASAAIMHMLIAATGKALSTPHTFLMLHEVAIGAKASEVGEDVDQGFQARIQRISEKVKRPVKDVRKDVTKDYYLNPLEALFYGTHGLIDGILVGPNQVITREDVLPYLIEKLGSKEKVEQTIQKRLEGRRYVEEELRKKFDVDDPFTNFLHTLEMVAQRGTRKLGEHPDFKHSGPDLKSLTLDYFPVKPQQSVADLLLNIIFSATK